MRGENADGSNAMIWPLNASLRQGRELVGRLNNETVSLAGTLFESTGGYGAAFAVACALLATAGLVSLRIDNGARVFRWAARGAGA